MPQAIPFFYQPKPRPALPSFILKDSTPSLPFTLALTADTIRKANSRPPSAGQETIPHREASPRPDPVQPSHNVSGLAPRRQSPLFFPDPDSDVDRSESDTSEGSDSGGGLIPKPEGEVGRPNRGGYNLEEVLCGKHGWQVEDFRRIKV